MAKVRRYPGYKSALEIFPELDVTGRPTVPRTKVTGTPGKQWPYYTQYETETIQEPSLPTPQEIMDALLEEFQAQALTRTVDPKTGQIILRREMPRPELPSEMTRMPQQYRDLFRTPVTPEGSPVRYWPKSGEELPLTMTHVLPKPTGPYRYMRNLPTTDIERSYDLRASTQAPGAYVNPTRHFPETFLRTPMRSPDEYGMQLPAFGSTVSYPQRKVLAQPQYGTMAQLYQRLPRSTPGIQSTLGPLQRFRRYRR